MILGNLTIRDKDIKYIELVTWIESWIEFQFMTGNWANIRNQHLLGVVKIYHSFNI